METKDVKFIVVGCGFFGSVIAERIANELNENVLILEKRNHIGGNCYSEDHEQTGIHYHKYGTHIFHTNNLKVWNYINKFTEFNGYYHQVLTTYKNKVYQMPINLETINSFYNINLKPFEVDDFLKTEISKENYKNPDNFEEKAIGMMGRPLYEAFIKGYTKKQWQKEPKEMSASILQRLPFRTNYNESYYFSRWQGMPLNGYDSIFKNMLKHPKIKIQLGVDYFDIKDQLDPNALIIYTGSIDRFFDYKYGKLQYRTLILNEEIVPYTDYQGTSVMNFAEETIPFTRIHEPKHLHPERKNYLQNQSLIIKEYSVIDNGRNPYYPINDHYNQNIVTKYKKDAEKLNNVIIGGRLGEYKYYDMHDTINMALNNFENIKTNYYEKN